MLPEHDAQNIRTSVAMSLLTKHQTLLGQQTQNDGVSGCTFLRKKPKTTGGIVFFIIWYAIHGLNNLKMTGFFFGQNMVWKYKLNRSIGSHFR